MIEHIQVVLFVKTIYIYKAKINKIQPTEQMHI